MLLGCDRHRDLTEYELNENSFDAEAMAMIEHEIGIDIPDDAMGLRFHHIPPIDPIVFAKIKIPDDTEKLIEKQIGTLTFNGTDFPKGFANGRCKWWPSTIDNAKLSKKAFNNGYYIELYLVKDKKEIILYIKYFTI